MTLDRQRADAAEVCELLRLTNLVRSGHDGGLLTPRWRRAAVAAADPAALDASGDLRVLRRRPRQQREA
eukprot:scaffold2961_cov263-Prasinococcus_capsulatus_cf.AAC.7